MFYYITESFITLTTISHDEAQDNITNNHARKPYFYRFMTFAGQYNTC